MVESGRRERGGVGVWLVAGLVLLSVGAAAAAPGDFPKPIGMGPAVAFWEKVFAEWSEHQVAIHDNLHMEKVYGVVDLLPLAASGASDDVLYRERKRRTEIEKKRIETILGRLHARGSDKGLSAEERAVWDLFRDVPGRNRFLEARQRVRAQQGLKEKFHRGVEISRRYLPHMEEIFRREGLPLELTRLPFVESTFNVRAYSKVGAAGIWQFIPSSARIYQLRMNEIVDDRRDPLTATRAAARHLRDDYRRLGAWPLAVTAYNHGRGGIARAVRETGSTDLGVIVRRYKGRSFGFASRNFYASFLAALEVEREAEKHFGPLRFEQKLEFEEIALTDYVPFPTLARLAGSGVEAFHELNPAFERVVVDGKLYVPRGHVVRVPRERATAFRTAYASLPAGERFASQRVYQIEHRVARGQTVGAIARRYGSTVAAIQAANDLRTIHRIREGQILRIPTGGGQAPVAVAVASAGKRPKGDVEHRVTRGENLGSIARRYGTTVAAIQSANDLSSPRLIRAGQVLRIPGNGTAASRSAWLHHRVQRGQTVGGIARRYGTTVSAIRAANDLRSIHSIRPGQILKIPSG